MITKVLSATRRKNYDFYEFPFRGGSWVPSRSGPEDAGGILTDSSPRNSWAGAEA